MINLYLSDVFGRDEPKSMFGLRAGVPDVGTGDRSNMRMTPVVVGKVEDRTECNVGFVCLCFFYPIIDASGIDWEGARVNERRTGRSQGRDHSARPKGNCECRVRQVCRSCSMQ